MGVRATGAGGDFSRLSRAKPLRVFFWQTLSFSGRNQQPKMKDIFFVSIEPKNEIHSVQRDE